jgi:hypothetical protein
VAAAFGTWRRALACGAVEIDQYSAHDQNKTCRGRRKTEENPIWIGGFRRGQIQTTPEKWLDPGRAGKVGKEFLPYLPRTSSGWYRRGSS